MPSGSPSKARLSVCRPSASAASRRFGTPGQDVVGPRDLARALAVEVDGLRGQLLALAISACLGRPLISGIALPGVGQPNVSSEPRQSLELLTARPRSCEGRGGDREPPRWLAINRSSGRGMPAVLSERWSTRQLLFTSKGPDRPDPTKSPPHPAAANEDRR